MGENSEIFERLTRIEQIVARIDERTKMHDSAHNDHEGRLRELERESDKRKGVIAALSFFSSIVGAVLMWLFKAVFGGGN